MTQKLRDELLELIHKSSNTYARYLKKSHPVLFMFVDKFPGSNVAEKCFNAINDNQFNVHFCKECNQIIDKPFINFMKGYRSYCSGSCSSKANIKKNGTNFTNPKTIAKRKETIIARYGTNSMISINRKKSIETNQRKLGVDYPLQSTLIRDKVKENLLAEHGIVNVFQLPSVIEKIQETMMKHYGVKYALQNPASLKKQHNTMIERFGVDNPSKSMTIRDQIKKTNIERYGVENPMQSLVVQEKVKITCTKNHGIDNPMMTQTISDYSSQRQREESVARGELKVRNEKFKKMFLVEPLFTDQDFIDGKPTFWKHICGTVYESNWYNGMITVCPKPECRKQSTPQRSIYEYVRSLISDEIKVNFRGVITPYELDIYIPSKKLAIEMDGIYWHQDEKEELNKQHLCDQLGIQLIHITDLSWYSRTDVWKSIISSKLKVQERIGARQCLIKEVSLLDSKHFLQEHHFQGFVSHQVSLGLFYEQKLVAIMTFGTPRFNQSYDWELLRYASRQNLTVIGGASKLLIAFRLSNPGSIVTYAKKEYSNGNLYRKLGFSFQDQGSKSYFYLKGDKMISRYQAQKHKLTKLLGDQFNAELTEKENMRKAGYILVQDRGSFTFVLDSLR